MNEPIPDYPHFTLHSIYEQKRIFFAIQINTWTEAEKSIRMFIKFESRVLVFKLQARNWREEEFFTILLWRSFGSIDIQMHKMKWNCFTKH